MDIARSTKTTRALLVFSFVVLAFLAYGTPALAAKYQFSPATGTYPSGQNFTVQIQVNPEGAQVNTGEGTITYDTDKLQFVSLSDDNSAFNLWVTEPAHSAGSIKFAGGGTTPISSARSIMSITFKGKAEGVASISFSAEKLLSGAGTDSTTPSAPASITIGPAAAATPPPAATTPAPAATTGSRAGGVTPQAPRDIESPTHPDEDLWYATSTAQFTWDVPYGVTGVSIGLNEDPEGESDEIHSPPIAETTITDIEDGVWYFHVAYQNRNGWGEDGHYKIQIDTKPPEDFSIQAEGADLSAILTFKTTDELSGIDEYLILVNDIEINAVSEIDFANDGTYTLTGLSPGDQEIKIIAVDNAGNTTEASTNVTVTGELPTEGEEEDTGPGIFGPVYWISLIFVIIISGIVAMLIFERKKFAEEKDQIKGEAIEAGERLVNIFDVLREEIEEKILSLSHKPNMTDNERQILEGLKDALNVSEELLDKEIEDVRKLVK